MAPFIFTASLSAATQPQVSMFRGPMTGQGSRSDACFLWIDSVVRDHQIDQTPRGLISFDIAGCFRSLSLAVDPLDPTLGVKLYSYMVYAKLGIRGTLQLANETGSPRDPNSSIHTGCFWTARWREQEIEGFGLRDWTLGPTTRAGWVVRNETLRYDWRPIAYRTWPVGARTLRTGLLASLLGTSY